MKLRNLTIGNTTFKWCVTGMELLVIFPSGTKHFISLTSLTGRSFEDLQKSMSSRNFTVTPGDVAEFIRTQLLPPPHK
jgi:hypothetical protein